MRSLRVGPPALHLDLTVGQWAGDGLLAIFFFVAGLELKREFVAGDLRDPRRATLPIVSAIAAMTLPALLFVALSVSGGFAVPLFAFSPPASPSGPGRSGRVPRGPRTLGIIAGLVAGKSVGILGATYLVARFTRASLDDDLPWVDVLDLAILGAWGSPCRSSSASSPSPRAANSTST